MKQFSIILLAGLACLTACKKTDKEKPTFSVTSPADSSVFETGDVIPFSSAFFDNENLSQYKIDIHDDFDGHGHDKYLATIWNQILIQNITGADFNENRNIQIPDSSASGWYHFQVTCVDESGNQSETAFRSIFIKNMTDTVAPVVNLSSPIEDATFSLGSSVSVNADLSDAERVYIVNTRVRKPNSSNNLFLKADTFGTNQVTFNKIIPTSGSAWTAGEYELTFTVYDSYYNKTVQYIHFQLN